MREQIWRTKDGREIIVSDMTEEHVRNTLKLFFRKRINPTREKMKVSDMKTEYARNLLRIIIWELGEMEAMDATEVDIY